MVEDQFVKMPEGNSIELTFLETVPFQQVVQEVKGMPVDRFYYKTTQGIFTMGKLGKAAFEKYVAENNIQPSFKVIMTRHEPELRESPDGYQVSRLNFTFSSHDENLAD